MGVPSLAVRRYFFSQMSSEASWKEMEPMSLDSSFTTVFIGPRHSECGAALRGFQKKADLTRQRMTPSARATQAAARQPLSPETFPPTNTLERIARHKM